ncbi:MAG: hypothetical protein Q9157_008141, partial [Trypethelium eluteriae]
MSQTPGSARRATRSVANRSPGAHPLVSLPMTGSSRRTSRPSGNLPGVDAAHSSAYGARPRAVLPGLGSQLHAGEVGLDEAIAAEVGPAPIAEEPQERTASVQGEQSVVPEEQTVVPERSFVREAGAVAARRQKARRPEPSPREGRQARRARERLDEEVTQLS